MEIRSFPTPIFCLEVELNDDERSPYGRATAVFSNSKKATGQAIETRQPSISNIMIFQVPRSPEMVKESDGLECNATRAISKFQEFGNILDSACKGYLQLGTVSLAWFSAGFRKGK
jgi:hypothetical protein